MAVSALQQQAFVQQWGPYATQAGTQLGVNPVIILGQWANESGWGTNSGAMQNNVGGIMQPGTQTQQSFASPQDFTNSYVSTISNNFPGAVNAGTSTTQFVNGLSSGGSNGQLVYFGNASQANSYASSIQANGQTIAQINPSLATADMAQGPNDTGQGYGSSIDVGGTTPGTTYDPNAPYGTFGSETTPSTGTTAGTTSGASNIAGTLGADVGFAPGIYGGPQEQGLAPGVVNSITNWIGGIESAVGGAFKGAWEATVGQVENLALRFMIVLAAIGIIIVALWRLLDPDNSKITAMLKAVPEAA